MMMMARLAKQTALLGLLLFTSVAAFSQTAPNVLRPLSRSPYSLQRLYAEPSPTDEVVESKSTKVEAVSSYADGDPREALEQFGSLFSQMQEILAEGSNWDSDELEDKTRDFVRTYVKVVVPGVGYVASSLAVYISFFAFISAGLALSGRGYNDIVAAVSSFEPLRALLEKADPTWGNVAIALVFLELLSPVIIAVTLALTPKTMDVLRTNLNDWGWGEDSIDERVAELLNN